MKHGETKHLAQGHTSNKRQKKGFKLKKCSSRDLTPEDSKTMTLVSMQETLIITITPLY